MNLERTSAALRHDTPKRNMQLPLLVLCIKLWFTDPTSLMEATGPAVKGGSA
jgi:hypothetical protein